MTTSPTCASYSQTKLALGCDTTLVITSSKSSNQVSEYYLELWKYIFNFERQFSRFIPSSELSLFNRSAGMKVKISDQFRGLLQVAKRLSEQTDGLFNPFILPALQRAGYTKSFVEKYKNDTHDDYTTRSVVPHDNLKIGDNWAMIPYGTALDLGGCGKGYLADRLSELELTKKLNGFWFSIGGDVAGAGYDETGSPWTIYVNENPAADDILGYFIKGSESGFAVATSSTGIRKGKGDSSDWHHIIDPRNNRPAKSDIELCTVESKLAVEADVLASCAIILGSTDALDYLKDHGAKSALIKYVNSNNTIKYKSFGDMKHVAS